MTKDYVLINFNDTDCSDARVYLMIYDEKLVEELDSNDAEWEYEYWKLDGDYLTLNTEISDGKIVMVRTLFGRWGGCWRDIKKV